MVELDWQRRLAIVLSVVWLVLAGAISSNERNSLMTFLILGALPMGFCWGFAWVWAGFRKHRATAVATAPVVDEPRPESSVASATLFRTLAIVLLVGGVGVFYYAFTRTSVEPAGKIGYLLGFYFWVPVLVYFVWKGTFKRRRGLGALLFSLAFLGIAFYQAHGMFREEEEAKQLLSKVQHMMLKLMNGELIERADLFNAGQYSSMLLVTHDFLSGAFSDFQTLNTAIENSGLETILSPQTLDDPPQLNAALITLQDLSPLVDRTAHQIAARYDEFPHQIDAADIPDSVKAEFRTGAEGGIKRGKELFTEFFNIQKNFLKTAVEMLQFMQTRQGRFKEQGGVLIFDSQADLETYNQYLQLIQAWALQESEWRNKQLSTSAKHVERMQAPQ